MKTVAVDDHFAFENLAYGKFTYRGKVVQGMFKYRGKVIKRMRTFGTHDYTIYGIVFDDGSVTAVLNAKVRMCVFQFLLDNNRDRVSAVKRDLKALFDAHELAVDVYQSQYGLSKRQLQEFKGNSLQRQAFERSFYDNTAYMKGIREIYQRYQNNQQDVLESHDFTRQYLRFIESYFSLAGESV